MIDKSKRYLKTRMALDTLPTLEGKRIYFDSMAEMVMTRAQQGVKERAQEPQSVK